MDNDLISEISNIIIQHRFSAGKILSSKKNAKP